MTSGTQRLKRGVDEIHDRLHAANVGNDHTSKRTDFGCLARAATGGSLIADRLAPRVLVVGVVVRPQRLGAAFLGVEAAIGVLVPGVVDPLDNVLRKCFFDREPRSDNAVR